MRIFAIKRFHIWAKSHDLTDALLRRATEEIERGSVEANLGGNLYKKRIAKRKRQKWQCSNTGCILGQAENSVFIRF